jgi:hypothetical protein
VHAMRGIKPNGKVQTIEEGRAGTASAIKENILKNDLPAAVHTAEDLPVPMHFDQVWNGFHLDSKTLMHVQGDIAPSPGVLLGAVASAYLTMKLDEDTVHGLEPPKP